MALTDNEIKKVNDIYQQLDIKEAQLQTYKEVVDSLDERLTDITDKLDRLIGDAKKTPTKKK
jgi:hypothetical protein